MTAHAHEPRRLAVLQGQLGIGGSERQLELFLQQCDRRVWSPQVYVGSHLGPHAARMRDAGFPVTLLTGSPIRKLWQFRRAYRSQGGQALISWSSWTNVFAWMLVGMRAPRFGSFRNAGFVDLPVRLRRLWSWAGRAPLSTIVCNSEETAGALRSCSRTSQEVLFVPNAVEPVADVAAVRTTRRRELGVAEDDVLIMGIGRLGAQKAFDRFVQAVALCHEVHPVRAVIVGPDHENVSAELLACIAATGLPDGVIRYLGPTDSGREMVCAADIYLLSSLHEGMPNVVLEAMAAGVACVTTPVSGVSSLLTHDVEGLIAGHDVRSLADALLRLVEDPDLRRAMGARARRRLAEAYEPSSVYRPLWESLRSAVDQVEVSASAQVARRTRVADVLLCALSLPVTVPAALAVAVLIRVSSGGPVLHHATRIGQHGQRFRVHKFRTMQVGAAQSGPAITRAHDPRVTSVGRWLRRTKVDELPQLMNVLRGEMSLVGPRPEDPRYVDLDMPAQRAALAVRPGLTSPASLLYRNEQAHLIGPDWERTYREQILPDKLAVDCDYLRHASFRSYARTLAQTLLAVALPLKHTHARPPGLRRLADGE